MMATVKDMLATHPADLARVIAVPQLGYDAVARTEHVREAHGVDLTRMVLLERVDGGAAALHVAYLVVMTVLGWWFAARALTRRLAV